MATLSGGPRARSVSKRDVLLATDLIKSGRLQAQGGAMRIEPCIGVTTRVTSEVIIMSIIPAQTLVSLGEALAHRQSSHPNHYSQLLIDITIPNY